MYMLADWGHLPLIVSDGEQFASSMLCLITYDKRCISSCSVLSFKCKLDLYLRNIVDLHGRPEFNNNLDSMNYKQWWTPLEDLAAN